MKGVAKVLGHDTWYPGFLSAVLKDRGDQSRLMSVYLVLYLGKVSSRVQYLARGTEGIAYIPCTCQGTLGTVSIKYQVVSWKPRAAVVRCVVP